MGISGLMLSGFVLIHMAGNMLIFVSEKAYNHYGHGITSNPLYPLMGYGLLGVFVVHILMALSITRDNKLASADKYAAGPTNGAKAVSVASRTMIYSGSILLAFFISHLLTFKYGTYYSVNYEGTEMRDLAKLMFEVFKNPLYVFGYILSLVLLAVHLRHGFAAALQSIGFAHPRYTPAIKCFAFLYAVIVAVGFISQPLYVFIK